MNDRPFFDLELGSYCPRVHVPSICNKAAVICLTIGKQNELGGNRAYSRKESDKILVTGLSCRLINNHVGNQFSQGSCGLNLEQSLCVPCLGDQLP